MAKNKKTSDKDQIEFDNLSDEAKQAIADFVMDKLAEVLSPTSKADEDAEDDEAADDAEEEDGEEEEAEEESDDEEESEEEEESDDEEEEAEDDDEEESDDEEEEESDDEEEADDEEEEESDDEESEDDEEEAGDDDDPMTAIQGELDNIPESLFKQAKTESAAVNPKEMKAEMVGYFTRRGVSKKDAQAMVDSLKEKDLKACYADYYARFLDTEGEVHDVDDPYKASRIVKGKEVAVWCCNGVPMEDGKCAVNPKVKQPADKKSKDKPAKKGKVVKKSKK